MSTKRSAYRRDGPNGWDDPDNGPDDWADVGAHMARHGGVVLGESQPKPLDEARGGSSDARDARHGPNEHQGPHDTDDLDEDEDHDANPRAVPGDPDHDDHGHHDGDAHEARDGAGEHHDRADNDDDLDEDEDHGADPPPVPGDPGHDDHGHHDGDAHEARDGPGEHHDRADNDDDLDEDEDHDANPPPVPGGPADDDHGHHDGDAHEARDGPGEHQARHDDDDDLNETEDHGPHDARDGHQGPPDDENGAHGLDIAWGNDADTFVWSAGFGRDGGADHASADEGHRQEMNASPEDSAADSGVEFHGHHHEPHMAPDNVIPATIMDHWFV